MYEAFSILEYNVALSDDKGKSELTERSKAHNWHIFECRFNLTKQILSAILPLALSSGAEGVNLSDIPVLRTSQFFSNFLKLLFLPILALKKVHRKYISS